MWDKLVRLGKQQSTWRGLLFLATAFGVHVAPELQTLILTGCFGVVGASDVLKDESRRRTDAEVKVANELNTFN
jgi:hypothetical protein